MTVDMFEQFREDADRLARDRENLKRTQIPNFKIGDRPIPYNQDSFPVKKGWARVPVDYPAYARPTSDGDLLVVFGEDPFRIRLMDATGDVLKEFTFKAYEIIEYFYNDEMDILYLFHRDGDRNKKIGYVDLRNNVVEYDPPVEVDGYDPVILVEARGDSALVSFSTYVNDRAAIAVEMWDAGLTSKKWRWAEDVSATGYRSALAFGKDTVAVGLPSGRLMLLDRGSGEIVHEFPYFGHNVSDAVFLHDDEILLCASHLEIKVLSLLTGETLFSTLPAIRNMKFKPVNGGRLVVEHDGGAFLTDLNTGACLRSIGHKGDRVSTYLGRPAVFTGDMVSLVEDVDAAEVVLDGPEAGVPAPVSKNDIPGPGIEGEPGGDPQPARPVNFLHYNSGDEVFIFGEGDFTFRTGEFNIACKKSFIMDDWAQWTTSYLRPDTGDIKLTGTGRFKVFAPSKGPVNHLSRSKNAPTDMRLGDNSSICLGEDELREYDYDFDSAVVKKILDAGGTEGRLNLVFLGDGYTEEDLAGGGVFERTVNEAVERITAAFPLSAFRDAVNVCAVYMPSKDRGADNSPKEDNSNTAFNTAYYGLDGVPSALIVQDRGAVSKVLKKVEAFDIVGVIVNDPRMGGTGEIQDGGFLFTASATEDISGIILHEMGHTLAKLGDEYESPEVAKHMALPSEGDVHYPNLQVKSLLDQNDLASTLKWRLLYKKLNDTNKVGAVEGGYYRPAGVFRPRAECRMRNAVNEFCPVCAMELYKILCRITGRAFVLDEFLEQLP